MQWLKGTDGDSFNAGLAVKCDDPGKKNESEGICLGCFH